MAKIDSQVSAPLQTAQAPQAPVEPVGNDAITGALKGFAKVGAAALGNFLEGKEERQQNSISQNMATRLRKVAEAHRSGQRGFRTSSEALSKAGAIYDEALAAGGKAEDIAKLFNQITTTSGLGKVITQKTPEEKVADATREATASLGWTSSDYSEEANLKIDGFYQQQQSELRHLEMKNKQRDAELKTLELSGKQDEATRRRIKMIREQAAADGEGLLKGSLDIRYNTLETQLKEIEGRVATTPEQILQKQRDAEEAIFNINKEVTDSGADFSDPYISAMVKPLEDLGNLYLRRINGTDTKESFETQAASSKSRHMALIAADPVLGPVLAASSVAPFFSSMLDSTTSEAMTNFLKKNGAIPAGEEGEEGEAGEREPANMFTKAVSAVTGLVTGAGQGGGAFNPPKTAKTSPQDAATIYFDGVAAAVQALLDGTLEGGDAAVADVQSHLDQIFNGIDYHSRSITSPDQWKPIVAFLSDPRVGKLMESGKAGIKPEYLAAAKEVIQREYDSTVFDLIAKEYHNASIVVRASGDKDAGYLGLKRVAISDVMDISFSGGVPTMTVKKGVTDPRLIKDARLRAEKIKAPLRKLVMMSAHVEGTTQYDKYFDNNEEYSRLRPQEEAEAAPEPEESFPEALPPKQGAKLGSSTMNPETLKLAQAALDKGAPFDEVKQLVPGADLFIQDELVGQAVDLEDGDYEYEGKRYTIAGGKIVGQAG